MNSREIILNRLRQAKHSAAQAGDWSFPSPGADLNAQFGKALAAAKGEVLAAENLENAWEVLSGVLSDLAAGQIVFNDDPPLSKEVLELKLPQYQWIEALGDRQALREICLNADVGLTGAQFALAETGSIGVVSGTHHSRMVSLVPPVHVVLLSEKALVADLITWEDRRPNPMPSQIVFISGPSKTADIEQTLVVGAHGPKKLIVIVYGET